MILRMMVDFDDFEGRGVACDRKFWSLVTASFGRL